MNDQLSLDDYRLSRRVGTEERSLEAAFWTFHRAHPEVYAELVRRARQMQERGLHFGIRTLWEAMRWDFAVAREGAFKLNDRLTSRYARLVMQTPDLAGVFETRELRSA